MEVSNVEVRLVGKGDWCLCVWDVGFSFVLFFVLGVVLFFLWFF